MTEAKQGGKPILAVASEDGVIQTVNTELPQQEGLCQSLQVIFSPFIHSQSLWQHPEGPSLPTRTPSLISSGVQMILCLHVFFFTMPVMHAKTDRKGWYTGHVLRRSNHWRVRSQDKSTRHQPFWTFMHDQMC